MGMNLQINFIFYHVIFDLRYVRYAQEGQENKKQVFILIHGGSILRHDYMNSKDQMTFIISRQTRSVEPILA